MGWGDTDPCEPDFSEIAQGLTLDNLQNRDHWLQQVGMLLVERLFDHGTDEQGHFNPLALDDETVCWDLARILEACVSDYLKKLPPATAPGKVHFITSDSGDWIRMYVDGEYVRQGHNIAEEEVASALVGSDNVTSEEWPYDDPRWTGPIEPLAFARDPIAPPTYSAHIQAGTVEAGTVEAGTTVIDVNLSSWP